MYFRRAVSVSPSLTSFAASFSTISAASIDGALTSLNAIAHHARSVKGCYHYHNKGIRVRGTYLRLTFALIFDLKLSLVTSSSPSSLNANTPGASLILRLIHSCRMTSSTASVGSIRTLTVRPSFVVTVFVGMRPVLADPLAFEGPALLGAAFPDGLDIVHMTVTVR